jgi:NADH-quinone oxidoreductase subunit N
MNYSDIFVIAPISFLAIISLVVLVNEALVKKSEGGSYWFSVFGLFFCMLLSLSSIDLTGTVFNRMVNVGGIGSIFSALFSLSALLTVVLSREYLRMQEVDFGEYYLLILFSTLGMILMATAGDLIMIFLGLELMSVCLYVLAGFLRRRPISNESSLKYFLLGAFATGFLLFGIALLYGASGTTNISDIISKYSSLTTSSIFWIGVGFFLIGLSFKIGAVPFHMWIPDVYQGSPTTVSGFMSTGGKAAAFSAFIVVFSRPEFASAEKVKLILAILSAGSMIIGNVIAISQNNIKRMLAYSSIAHAGYMLAGLAASNITGKNGVLFYLVTYTFMNIGAFGVLALLERQEEKNLTFDDYAGLGVKRPLLAALMSVFMFSLAGIPPFAGFFGKYYVFLAAVQSNLTWLAILGVMMSVVSIYYYLRLVMVMYFRDPQTDMPVRFSLANLIVLCFAAFAVIEIGIYPSTILSLLNNLY